MSPVERTAAWVLNNGQYEDEQEEGQSREDSRHIEKVDTPAHKLQSLTNTISKGGLSFLSFLFIHSFN